MSVQDKNVGFELNETDFPELSGKLTGRKEKGRRSAVADRHARQAAKAGAFLVKTIDDPNHVLGKKRKERVASESHDGLASHVVYSMNKNKRWEAMEDGASWVANDNATELNVQLIERVLTSKDTLDNVVSLKEMNKKGETMRHEVAGGKGANILTLLTAGTSKKEQKTRKESEASVDENDEPKEPKVQYTIYKPHKNHKVLAGKMFSRNYNIRKAGKVRQHLKRVDVDEMSMSMDEMNQSVHIFEDAYKPSRDFRFCLGDYITPESTATKPVFVRRQSIESVQPSEVGAFDELEDREKNQPLLVLDISHVLKARRIFDWTLIDISDWNDLEKQVEDLQHDSTLCVQWLDVDSIRFSIDASRRVLGEMQPYGAPVIVIVVERALMNKQPHLKVLINSTVSPNGHITAHTLCDVLRSSKNLSDMVTIIAKLIANWKETSGPECLDDLRDAKSRIDRRSNLFHLSTNSLTLAGSAEVISAETLAVDLRERSKNSECNEERFERIDFETDDFDFEDADEVKELELEKLKCVTCDCTKNSELFELDDCWQCRECLRKHIIDQIRAKCIPLKIPFVLGEGQSAYDILPAIIPLALLNFYTKIAVTESMENCEKGEIGECPACNQLVHIKPNDYNSTMCNSCSTLWCPKCEREPHFPMTCSAYAAWIVKWEKEYEMHVINKTDFLKRITCCCGFFMEVREEASSAECGGCGRIFCPQDMRMLECHYWGREKTGAPKRCLTSDKFLPAQSVEVVVASKQIKKEISETCGKARQMRFSDSKRSEFEKTVRKLKKTYPNAANLRDIRKTVLCIVENGLAYVYTEKNKKAMALKPQIMQLMKQWLDMEQEVQHPSNDFATRLSAIEQNTNKVLEQLKQIDSA